MRRSSHAPAVPRPSGPAPAFGAAETALARPTPRRGQLKRFSISGELPPVSLNYSVQKHSLVQVDGTPPQLEMLSMLGDPCHYRMQPLRDAALGHAEFCGLADGFYVHFSDVTHTRLYPLAVSAPNMLRVCIASDIDVEYVAARGDQLDMTGPSAAIIIEPSGVPPAEAVFAGHARTANVYVHRSTLKRLYAQREDELPAVLRAFVAGRLHHTVAQRLPLGPGLLRCLEDLHGCDLDGHGRRLFIRSKAIEILCRAFKALAEDDGLGSPEASTPTTRGVLKAQRVLMERFVTPPSLEELAQAVGLSRSSLCAGFRQIVGQTVFDYIADLRMQHALALLNERNASITQIAYDVGYSHPSSFTLAVQRRFGTTPSELRRRGLPAA